MPAGGRNPYARPPVAEDGNAPDPSGQFVLGGPGKYAVQDPPDSSSADYSYEDSPHLNATGAPQGNPSDIRIGTRQPPANDPNKTNVWLNRYSDLFRRLSVEQTTEGWKVQQHKVPPGQNPLWTQERMPIRPTADSAPAGYMFTRPWHIPRNIKDALGENAVDHFSLADHRRTFEIMGMKPQGGTGVNTYRADPVPWDRNLFVPPEPTTDPDNGVFGRRNYRL